MATCVINLEYFPNRDMTEHEEYLIEHFDILVQNNFESRQEVEDL